MESLINAMEKINGMSSQGIFPVIWLMDYIQDTFMNPENELRDEMYQVYTQILETSFDLVTFIKVMHLYMAFPDISQPEFFIDHMNIYYVNTKCTLEWHEHLCTLSEVMVNNDEWETVFYDCRTPNKYKEKLREIYKVDIPDDVYNFYFNKSV